MYDDNEPEEVLLDDDDPSEPEDEDWYTTDYAIFRRIGPHGKPLHVLHSEDWREVLRKQMNQDQFWPNIWALSDHGNWFLLSLDV